MNTILAELGRNPKFIELLNKIENNESPVVISGLNDMGLIQIGTAINEFGKKPILILTYNEIQAKKIYEDILYFTDKVELFPKKEILTYDYVAESKDIPYKRIDVLNKIKTRKNLIVIASIETVMQKIPEKRALYKNEFKFKLGESYNLESIKKKLIQLGYTRCDLIEGRGQFSIRGGIIDIATGETTGIRVELWGDEVDSIRIFNISTQRSISNKETAVIYPAHEYILEQDIESICEKIKNNNRNVDDRIVEEDIEQIKSGSYISKIDKYFNSFYEKQETILDYLNENYCIFLDQISKIRQRIQNIKIDNENLKKALIEKERVVPEAITNYLDLEQVDEIIKRDKLLI